MAHTDIHESGICQALPLRDAWGRPHADTWWSERQVGEAASRPTRPALPAAAAVLAW